MPVWDDWDLKKEPEGSLSGDKKWGVREKEGTYQGKLS